MENDMIALGSQEAQAIVKRNKELALIRQSIYRSLERIHELVEKGQLESVPYEMDWIRTLLERARELNTPIIPNL